MSSAPDAPHAQWDVFVSYSRSDTDTAEPIVASLRERGLRVFVDNTAVGEFASITNTIALALARSRVLLALYSRDYPRRRACQWELTYAYIAGQREGDPRHRVLVINPEPTTDHIQPVELRDARYWPWPRTPEAAARLADSVAAHAGRLERAMGECTGAAPVRWLPAPARTGSAHFGGRLAEQWHIHTALHRHRAPLVSQNGTGRTAQVRGMPGIGKSLLAQEYALHFGPAFPGGVFWYDLHTRQKTESEDPLTRYAAQVATAAVALGIDPDGPLPRLLSRLAVALGERDAPCLWVVDGVPDGLTEEELHLLRGPHLLASTLITTRSLRYSAFAEAVDVPPLPDADGLRLLTSRREPATDQERAAALALVHDVGGHPYALGLLADLAAASDFPHLRDRFHSPVIDVLDHRGRAPEQTSFSAQLLPQSLSEAEPVSDVLRLFALACPAPLTRDELETALASLALYDPWEAQHLAMDAVETLLGTGTLIPSRHTGNSWTVHPLLARAVRRGGAGSARQEDLRRALLHALALPTGTTAAASAPQPTAITVSTTPGAAERAAAFDLQIELITRVGVQPLAPDQGSLREALTSLHSLFATARDVLHRVASEPTTSALPRITATLLNTHLRPFLSTWHPLLQDHEANRPPHTSPTEHERLWPHAAEMRQQLDALRMPLTATARSLGELCGTDLTSV
ncbi:toll/interleukin-1 receptor domain-containing protein [Streptomyces sp. LaPpAH-108]|uniref:toll/interleukin-1 receptor domain-containing protein n=1 Tax=Streptomyces sp. LaPpAH-108 TaxID=1155714 RepID=UPI0003631C41|nr:toll/interleukin-1 receptor domain-containing protein [Streptomyces sp. LaPpAH-108]